MWFKRLFKGEETSQQGQGSTECPHKVLTPRWDSTQDMGHPEKAVGYNCMACGAVLDREEAEAIRRRHEAITM